MKIKYKMVNTPLDSSEKHLASFCFLAALRPKCLNNGNSTLSGNGTWYCECPEFFSGIACETCTYE